MGRGGSNGMYGAAFGDYFVSGKQPFAAERQADLIDHGKILIHLGQEVIFQGADCYALISGDSKKHRTDESYFVADIADDALSTPNGSLHIGF